jgi:hypothetical protein
MFQRIATTLEIIACKRINVLDAENARLREALAFYADLNAYYDEYGHTDLAAGDAGARARAALAETKEGASDE